MGTTTTTKRASAKRRDAEAYRQGLAVHRTAGHIYAYAEGTPNPEATFAAIVRGIEILSRTGNLNEQGLRNLAAWNEIEEARKGEASPEARERRTCERAIVTAVMERRGGLALAEAIKSETAAMRRRARKGRRCA